MKDLENYNTIIPAEINSEPRFTKYITMRTLMIVMGVFIVANTIKDVVHPSLTVYFMFFSLFVGITLIIPSNANGGKRLYQTLMLSMRKDTAVYHAINPVEVDDDEY